MTVLATTGEGLEFLPQRSSPCLHKLSVQRSWTRTLAVRNGDHLVGVRVNTEWAAALLEGLLAGLRVPELDEAAPPNFSVELASPVSRSGRRRDLHLIYRDHAVVARRADTEEILLDLLELLHEPARWREETRLAVHATALCLREGGVALLPWEWHGTLLSHQRRLAVEGHELLVPHTHVLEPSGILTTEPVTTGRATRAAQNLPVRLWAVDVPGGEAVRLRPSAGVHAAARGVANVETLGARRTLDQLAGLARDGLPYYGVSARTRTVLRTVAQLADSAALDVRHLPAPHTSSAPGEISPEGLFHDEPTRPSVDTGAHT